MSIEDYNKKHEYFNNLDGLRAIAAVSVVFQHASNWFPTNDSFNTTIKKYISFQNQSGAYGVYFFFYPEWLFNNLFII